MGRGRVVGLVALAVVLVTTAVAWGAPGDPQRVFNPRDQAHAKTIILHTKDLPGKGWKTEATDFSGDNPACMVKDYSLEKLTVNGEAGYSFGFGSGILQLESDGHVFSTPAEATKAAELFSSRGLARCLGSAFAAGIHKSEPTIKVTIASVDAGPVKGFKIPARGTRVLLKLSSKKVNTATQIVQIILTHGRDQSSLVFVSTGGPWPEKAMRQLTALVAGRM